MESTKTILITGSNKGIGFTLAQQLTKTNKYYVIMTSRNSTFGEQALKVVKSKHHQSLVFYHQLDICSQESIQKIVQYFADNKISIDVLVNNAALGYDQPYEIPKKQLAQSYFKCNYYATVNFTEQMLRFLSKDAKIINISSRTGALENHSSEIQKQLSNPNITKQDISDHIQRYLKGCQNKNLEGYYKSSYGTSKTFLNVWHQKQIGEKQSAILMSPGFCLTDMIKNSIQDPRTMAPPPKDPLVGVQTILYIIEMLPYDGSSSGKFYYDSKEWDIYRMK